MAPTNTDPEVPPTGYIFIEERNRWYPPSAENPGQLNPGLPAYYNTEKQKWYWDQVVGHIDHIRVIPPNNFPEPPEPKRTASTSAGKQPAQPTQQTATPPASKATPSTVQTTPASTSSSTTTSSSTVAAKTTSTPAQPIMATTTDADTAKIKAFEGEFDRVGEMLGHFELKFILESVKFGGTGAAKKQVAYALSCCQGGTAGSWAAGKVAYYAANQWPTWAEFVADFKKQFQPADAMTTAIARMASLRQTGPVTEYNSEFRKLVAAANISQVPLVKHYYCDGLKGPLKQKVMSVDPGTLNDFDKLYACAERFDEEWRASVSLHSGSRSSNDNRPRSRRVRAADTQPAQNTAVVGKLTDAERSKLMKEGKCFRCRQSGHMANACPKYSNYSNKKFPSRNVRHADVDPDPEYSDNLDKDQVIAALKNLSSEERKAILDDDQVFD